MIVRSFDEQEINRRMEIAFGFPIVSGPLDRSIAIIDTASNQFFLMSEIDLAEGTPQSSVFLIARRLQTSLANARAFIEEIIRQLRIDGKASLEIIFLVEGNPTLRTRVNNLLPTAGTRVINGKTFKSMTGEQAAAALGGVV